MNLLEQARTELATREAAAIDAEAQRKRQARETILRAIERDLKNEKHDTTAEQLADAATELGINGSAFRQLADTAKAVRDIGGLAVLHFAANERKRLERLRTVLPVHKSGTPNWFEAPGQLAQEIQLRINRLQAAVEAWSRLMKEWPELAPLPDRVARETLPTHRAEAAKLISAALQGGALDLDALSRLAVLVGQAVHNAEEWKRYVEEAAFGELSASGRHRLGYDFPELRATFAMATV